jgi:hypothetical protein
MNSLQRVASSAPLAILLSIFIAGVRAQAPPESPLAEAYVQRLPVAYQEPARKLTASDAWQQFFIGLSDEELEGEIFALLAAKPDGAEFLSAQLEKEPSGRARAQIVVALEQHLIQHPQEQAMLEKRVSSDPDPTAALAALETLRRVREAGLRELLENRLKSAQNGDENTARKLRNAYLAHYTWYGDVHMPKFAYAPPPVFQAKPAGQLVRVLAFGDLAYGPGGAQVKTAAAMRAYHREHPFDFGITLGDNFYGRGPLEFKDREGLSSPYDPRWQTEWEQLYGPMGIKFYPAIGNADYIDPDGPAAELAYTRMSKTWFFPAPYYTYTAGSVQFFAIDNIRLSDEELDWLDSELAKSKAHWKVVYGHYQIYSPTGTDDNEELVTRLLPVLRRNSVDVWINGHLHEMQELEPQGSLHFFISGAGGAPLSTPSPTYKRSKFTAVQHGFSIIEADQRHFDVAFVNGEGQELSRSHITK